MVNRFLRDRSGATAVEYGLIVAVLSLAIVGGVSTVADSMVYLFTNSESELVKVWSR